MTVKKTLSLKRPTQTATKAPSAGGDVPDLSAAAPAAGGGATIADRFKLPGVGGEQAPTSLDSGETGPQAAHVKTKLKIH